jgi:hypothetical protein
MEIMTVTKAMSIVSYSTIHAVGRVPFPCLSFPTLLNKKILGKITKVNCSEKSC